MQYHCCGVKGYGDWNRTRWREKEAGEGQLAPETCCKPQFSSGHNCSYNSSMIYHTVSLESPSCLGIPLSLSLCVQGCVDVLMDRTEIAADCAVGGVVVGVALNLATVALVFRAIYLIRRYQNYSVI